VRLQTLLRTMRSLGMPSAAGVHINALHTQQRQNPCRRQWRQTRRTAGTVVAAPAHSLAQPSEGSVMRLQVAAACRKVRKIMFQYQPPRSHSRKAEMMLQFLPFTAGQGQCLRRQAAGARRLSWAPARQAS
jgi:hypothetical protein